MTYGEFLTRIIDEGLAAARESYVKDAARLAGAVAGFEACRDKGPTALGRLLAAAQRSSATAYWCQSTDEYWERVAYADEVEWVCNCVSARLVNEGGRPLASYMPTARAVIQLVSVVGMQPQGGPA